MGSKKNVKSKQTPEPRSVVVKNNPDEFYSLSPSWCFNDCDDDMWPFNEEHIGNSFWSKVLPYLKNLEKQTWQEILVDDKKKNHGIIVSDLNSIAQKRLAEKYIECEAIYSLRVNGTNRIYGQIIKGVFYVLWYDDDHGDNDRCVCRSYKK